MLGVVLFRTEVCELISLRLKSRDSRLALLLVLTFNLSRPLSIIPHQTEKASDLPWVPTALSIVVLSDAFATF